MSKHPTLDECIETEDYLNDDGGADRLTDAEIDELQERLRLAEEILDDLSSGWWVAKLDGADVGSNLRMGQRVLEYWRKREEKGGG